MNNDIRTTLQFICLTTVLLLGGCQKQTEETVPTLSFQLPEEWSYTADEDITDWGFLIQVT